MVRAGLKFSGTGTMVSTAVRLVRLCCVMPALTRCLSVLNHSFLKWNDSCELIPERLGCEASPLRRSRAPPRPTADAPDR